MPISVAYLGPAGTYTEEAATLYDAEADLQSFPTIAAVGLAVSSGITDQGVVPIENSLEGAVNFTLDLLISQSGLYIRQEIVLPIQHFLMARAGTRPADLEVIYSHPQSLGQCREFLERCFPGVQQMASLSNAAAVVDMKESGLVAAAIAPRRAATLYEVEIIGSNIQDNPNNATRFVVLDKEDHPPTGGDKTSMCLSIPGRCARNTLRCAGGVRATRHQPGKDRVPPDQAVPGRVHLSGRLRRSPDGLPDPGGAGGNPGEKWFNKGSGIVSTMEGSIVE